MMDLATAVVVVRKSHLGEWHDVVLDTSGLFYIVQRCKSREVADRVANAIEQCQQLVRMYMSVERTPGAYDPPADDECDAYDLDDPKHPTYRERMLDRADIIRKSQREDQ